MLSHITYLRYLASYAPDGQTSQSTASGHILMVEVKTTIDINTLTVNNRGGVFDLCTLCGLRNISSILVLGLLMLNKVDNKPPHKGLIVDSISARIADRGELVAPHKRHSINNLNLNSDENNKINCSIYSNLPCAISYTISYGLYVY